MNEKPQTKERTRTATTPHGDVEYRTVVCSSCGQEVRKDDALRFVIGDLQVHKTWISYEEYRPEIDTDRAGWACSYCADIGPIAYPQPSSTVRARLGAALSVSDDTADMVLTILGWTALGLLWVTIILAVVVGVGP